MPEGISSQTLWPRTSLSKSLAQVKATTPEGESKGFKFLLSDWAQKLLRNHFTGRVSYHWNPEGEDGHPSEGSSSVFATRGLVAGCKNLGMPGLHTEIQTFDGP